MATKGRTLTHRYESLSDLCDAIDGAQHVDGRADQSQRLPARQGWDLSVGFDGAVALARSGWSEHRAAVDALASQVVSVVESVDTMPAPFWDVSGSFVDIGAYLAGTPECMVSFTDVEVPKARVVRVGFQVMCTAATSADTMVKRGAACVALVEILERSGYSVELTCVLSGSRQAPAEDGTPRSTDSVVELEVMVKRAGEPMDIDRFMFSAAHPAMFRRIMFGWSERVAPDDVWAVCQSRYYYPCGARSADAYDMGAFGRIHGRDDVSRDPIGWVRSQLARLEHLGAAQ